MFIFLGPPDSPVIQRTLTEVTAVSVNLVWLSGFNGGSKQTFTVTCHPSGSKNPIVVKDIPDPGYQQTGNVYVGNLKESTEYKFTVQTKNLHTGVTNINKSKTETFVTKGRITRITKIIIYRNLLLTQHVARTLTHSKIYLW